MKKFEITEHIRYEIQREAIMLRRTLFYEIMGEIYPKIDECIAKCIVSDIATVKSSLRYEINKLRREMDAKPSFEIKESHEI